MTNTIEIPFDIKDVQIIGTELNEAGQYIITVVSTIEGTCCHGCGKTATKLDEQGDERVVRHTSSFGLETYIRFFPKRDECPHCGKQHNSCHVVSLDAITQWLMKAMCYFSSLTVRYVILL